MRRVSAGRPALRSSSPRNARLSAMLFPDLRQEGARAGRRLRGSGRPRRRGSARAGRPRRRSAAASAPRAARPRRGTAATRRRSSGGKRGSRNAAPSAFCATSSPSGRAGLEAADAAAQLAGLGQRDEGRAGLREPRQRRWFLRAFSVQLALRWRRARCESSVLPASVERHLAALVKRERRSSRPPGPCRRRCRRNCRRRAASARDSSALRTSSKPVQRRRAAGLLVIDVGGEARDALRASRRRCARACS